MQQGIFSRENIEKVIHVGGFFIFISYVLGFLIWNKFLSNYGFFEYNLLQTRYLSAGIMSLFFHFPFLFLIWEGLRRTLRIHNKIMIILLTLEGLLFSTVLVYTGIFVTMPPALGGGRPSVISLLGSTKQIEYLGEFGIPMIPNGDKKLPVQTDYLCGLYENSDYFIVGIPGFQDGKSVAERVMVIKKDEIIGFQPFPYQSFPYQWRSFEELMVASSSLSGFRKQICDPFVGYTNLRDLLRSWFGISKMK